MALEQAHLNRLSTWAGLSMIAGAVLVAFVWRHRRTNPRRPRRAVPGTALAVLHLALAARVGPLL